MNINSHICPVNKETCGFLTVCRLVTWWARLAFCSGELSKLEKGVARPAPEQRHMRSIETICNSSNIFQCSNRDVCQTYNNSQIAYDKIWGEELDSDKKRVHHLHLELERIAQSAYLGAGIVLSETLFQTDPLKGRYISSHVIPSSHCILGICRFCILWILRLFASASVFVLLSSSESANIRVVSYETGARCLFAPPIRHGTTPCLFCTGWCGFLIGIALWVVCQKKLTTARCSKKVGPDIVWQTAPCFHNMFVTSSHQMFLAQPSTRCLVQSGTSGRASFDFPHLERHMSIGFLPASCGTSVLLHTAQTACFFMQFLHCLCHEKNGPSSCKVWQWFDNGLTCWMPSSLFHGREIAEEFDFQFSHESWHIASIISSWILGTHLGIPADLFGSLALPEVSVCTPTFWWPPVVTTCMWWPVAITLPTIPTTIVNGKN